MGQPRMRCGGDAMVSPFLVPYLTCRAAAGLRCERSLSLNRVGHEEVRAIASTRYSVHRATGSAREDGWKKKDCDQGQTPSQRRPTVTMACPSSCHRPIARLGSTNLYMYPGATSRVPSRARQSPVFRGLWQPEVPSRPLPANRKRRGPATREPNWTLKAGDRQRKPLPKYLARA